MVIFPIAPTPARALTAVGRRTRVPARARMATSAYSIGVAIA
ncbi:hypothetical protein [Ottowia sp.]